MVAAAVSAGVNNPLSWSSRFKAFQYDKARLDSSKPYWHLVYDTKTNKKSEKQVLGFTTYYNTYDKNSYESMVTNYPLIDQIATHTYITDGYGNITGLVPKSQLDFANKKGIKTLATVLNNFDRNIAKTLLESPQNRTRFIKNLVAQLRAQKYQGVNIDIEAINSNNRSHFTQLLREVYYTLHPMGYTVTVSVGAKTWDNPNDGWSGAYDYKEISKYADNIVLMTYDEHYIGGYPGAIASIGWFENVIKYASRVIPKNKIIVGLAAYGYDWSSAGTKSYSIGQAYNVAKKYNAPVQFDQKSKTPYFSYRDEKGIGHSVWFENSTSIGYKLDAINKYGINGIAIWKIGLEDSSYWSVIKNKFKN
jgi:spore germination protein YaaH